MTQSIPLAGSGMIALTRDALAALRAALFRDLGADAANYLQEAGYAGGGALFSAFGEWSVRNGYGPAASIAADDFQRCASEFFRDLGWGSIALGTLHGAVGTLDSADWGEADPQAAMEFPGCHLTTGMFADFFGRLADTPMAVMEVECRSMGAPRCRFLLGSTDALHHVYEEMSRGVAYEDAVAASV
ncbi:MAG TPA: V4R domain-containing protein [Gemmatimonadaceae bacterium]|nr:V4R domain-containing protein [Gemmatimonadaceae bacterium]